MLMGDASSANFIRPIPEKKETTKAGSVDAVRDPSSPQNDSLSRIVSLRSG